MKELSLHAHTTGPNPYKVAFVLEVLKLPYKTVIWDFGDGQSGVKGPELTKLNPNGRVPVLCMSHSQPGHLSRKRILTLNRGC